MASAYIRSNIFESYKEQLKFNAVSDVELEGHDHESASAFTFGRLQALGVYVPKIVKNCDQRVAI